MDINLNQMPEELRKKYLARRGKDIEDCFIKLPVMDWAYFERLGHQLKGNAPSYGYEDLGQIASRIEVYAREKDIMRLEQALYEFKDWVQKRR